MCYVTSVRLAKFEYSSLIGQCSNHRSLMLITWHVRLALCTLKKKSGTLLSYWTKKLGSILRVPWPVAGSDDLNFCTICTVNAHWKNKTFKFCQSLKLVTWQVSYKIMTLLSKPIYIILEPVFVMIVTHG